MELKTYYAQDIYGNIVANASVSVYEYGTANLASGLQDSSGDSLANPFTADSNGQISFAAPDGKYTLQVTSTVGTTYIDMTVQFLDVEAQVSAANDSATAAAASATAASASAVSASDSATAADSSASDAASQSSSAATSADTASTQASAAATSATNAANSASAAEDAASSAESAVNDFKADLASTNTGLGSSLVAWMRNAVGAIARTLFDKNSDIIDIRDFVSDFTGTDQTTATQYALNAAAGKTLRLPGGGSKVGISSSLYVRAGTKLICEGKYDNWDAKTNGFVFQTIGSGNAQRWTDIDGNDESDDTPLMVACGNAVIVGAGIALITDPSSTPWSMGIFFPCVKQCSFFGQAFGFSDGCIYLDATWSSTNTTLTALHPEISSSTGMNEFDCRGSWAVASGSGFAFKVQGTTRAGDSVSSSSDWVWSPGGASDLLVSKSRLSGVSDGGGAISHDVQLYGVSAFGKGLTLRDCGLRLSGTAQYLVKLDRSDRIIFDGCYGESVGTATPVFAVTSRTQQGTYGVIRISDAINGSITLDGVATGATGANAPWQLTRCVTTKRADGRDWTPYIDGGRTSSYPLRLKSFGSNGLTYFSYDSGSGTPADYMVMNNTALRSITASSMNLGTQTYPFGTMSLNTLRINTGFAPYADNTANAGTGSLRFTQVASMAFKFDSALGIYAGSGSPEGVQTATSPSLYLRTDGAAGTFWYRKQSGTGNTGWVAIA